MLNMKNFITLLSIVFCLGISAARAQSDGVVITAIDVVGSQRIDQETVLAYTPIKVGDTVSNDDLNAALGRLFRTDLFKDVSLRIDGGRLIIGVVENPIINAIAIEGEDVLQESSLLDALGLEPRRVFTRKLALESRALLIEIYRQSGRYAAVIEPKIIALPDNRVDLVFEIDEGPLIKIEQVKFIGNAAFSDRALKNVIESRERKWYVFLSQNDKYDAARLRLDQQRLQQFYLRNGYADISIRRARGELTADRSGFILTFIIDEGDIYTINDVTVSSDIDAVNTDDLIAASNIEIGSQYDVRVLEDGLLRVTNRLGEQGYAFVGVSPDIVLNKENQTLDIHIKVGASARNYVEKIDIKGNDRTLDSVIRRKFELVEGDSFNRLKLIQSERNVRNLGYFSSVKTAVRPGSSPEQSVIEVEVEEQATGSFQLGFGYSTFDKGTVSIGLSERNFLGTGRGIRANFSGGGDSTTFRLGVTEPYLFGRNLLGSIDIFKEDDTYSDVEVEQAGLDFGLAFSAANDYRHRFGYILANTDTDSSAAVKARSVSGDEGTLLLSEISYSLSQDKRDSRIDPKNGYMWRVSQSAAGLGGDVQYLKTELRGQYLYPAFFNSVVFGVDGRFGYVDGLGEDVSRSSRFLVGGRTIRGFDSNGIGPRDIGDGTAVGGNHFYSASFNVTSDLGFDKDLGLRWTIFTDLGALWGVDNPLNAESEWGENNKGAAFAVIGADDDDPRSSIGYGLLWDTVIGPMSFIWAHPIDKQNYDKTQTFQFSFGGRF